MALYVRFGSIPGCIIRLPSFLRTEDSALSGVGTSGRKGIFYPGEGEWCKQSKRNSGRNQGYFQGKDREVVLLWCGSYCYRYHAFRIPAGYWY